MFNPIGRNTPSQTYPIFSIIQLAVTLSFTFLAARILHQLAGESCHCS